MRKLIDLQQSLNFFSFLKPKSKEIQRHEETYNKISKLIDANQSILNHVASDLSVGKKKRTGRNGFTVDQVIRCIIVTKKEGFSYREAAREIHYNMCFREFCRLGNLPMMDYSELNRLDNIISASTWDKINEVLDKYASGNSLINGSKLRSDTTAIETNIHYPTDSSLLWDTYRVISRFIKKVRKIDFNLVEDLRMHNKKYKAIVFQISRLAGQKDKKAEIKTLYKKLIPAVQNILVSAQRVVEKCNAKITEDPLSEVSLKLALIVKDLEAKIPTVLQIIDQAKRRIVNGENVPNDEKIFSLFEPHTELLKRGKAGKPVEFGHMVLLNQVESKYITSYETFEKRPNENKLVDPTLDKHKELFGEFPEVYAADKGFYESMKKLKKLEENIDVVAIGKKGKLNQEEKKRESLPAFMEGGKFRAGIEGSISGLKRVLSMARCLNKGFERFRSFVSSVIFVHNLNILASL